MNQLPLFIDVRLRRPQGTQCFIHHCEEPAYHHVHRDEPEPRAGTVEDMLACNRHLHLLTDHPGDVNHWEVVGGL